MKNLVIGNKGQIGSAIQKILECEGYDIVDGKFKYVYHNFMFNTMHITIPFSEDFVNQVSYYAEIIESPLIIIHSTVPSGTCDRFDKKFNVVYSPCRGVHPELEKGIRTFVKFFAGEKAKIASEIFAEKGIDVEIATNTRSLEAAKDWDTTQYGWNIVLEKLIHKDCINRDLDFDLVYTRFNKTYNEGFEKLGMPQYKKYILEHREGKIGGHCVIPNLEFIDSPICKIIKDLNID